MKTNYKIILYLLPIVLLFTTCRTHTTKPADQHFYYYLTKEQLSKTPYFTNPAFDTLTYISNLNDTLVFAKTKTDTLWYTSSVFDPGGTADKYYHYQQLRNSYATLQGEGKFEVIQKRTAYIHSEYLVNFLLETFAFPEDHIGWQGFPTYKKVYTLNNIDYFDVISINTKYSDTTTAMAVLNSSNGLFYFELKTNFKNYYLIPVL
jgi:hypothetical protein